MKNNNKEVAQKIVNRIIELIEKEGASLPWIKPWNGKPNTVTVKDGEKVITIYPRAWNRKGQEYKGANTYLPSGEYITFNQCKAEGGKVKPGAHGFPIVYWNFQKKKETYTNDETGETEEREITIPILKYYIVFNVRDCEGIEQKHSGEPRTITVPITHEEVVSGNDDLNETAEEIVADYVSRAGNGFHIDRVLSDQAYYSPSRDFVNVPLRSQFNSKPEFYSTLFHELAHSTGHSSRLNRFTGKAAHAAFGSEEYSREELVAEATAASVLNALDMEEANTFRNSAAYIKSWASHIKNDPLMYVAAMTRAQAAFDLLLGVPAE